jgi:hypothetical protein
LFPSPRLRFPCGGKRRDNGRNRNRQRGDGNRNRGDGNKTNAGVKDETEAEVIDQTNKLLETFKQQLRTASYEPPWPQHPYNGRNRNRQRGDGNRNRGDGNKTNAGVKKPNAGDYRVSFLHDPPGRGCHCVSYGSAHQEVPGQDGLHPQPQPSAWGWKPQPRRWEQDECWREEA